MVRLRILINSVHESAIFEGCDLTLKMTWMEILFPERLTSGIELARAVDVRDDYDTERTGGQVVCAWPLDEGTDADRALCEALRTDGIHYTTETVDTDKFFGLEPAGASVAACLRCGHPPCSACRTWCDNMIPGTGILCCDGRCIYPGEPGAETMTITDWPTSEARPEEP